MYTSYCHGFRLPVDISRFPSDAFETKMRSLYDSLSTLVGIPSIVVGPIVLHAGIAYANPVASMVSPNGRADVFGINTMVSAVSGCGISEAKKYAFGPMFQFQPDQLANVADGAPHIETHVLNSATMPTIIKEMAEYSIDNKIVDEFTSSHTGSTAQHASVRNQLTSIVLTRPDVRIAFDENHGIRLRTMGLAARTQFSEYDGAPVSLNLVEIDTTVWDTNCRRLQDIRRDIKHERVRRDLKKFRPDGIRVLKEIRDDYLLRGQQGNDLAMLPEHAACQPENIQRIATGIAVFEGLAGDISAETVERAATLGFWFTEWHKQRFLVKREIPQGSRKHAEAARLEQVLLETACRIGENMFILSDLLSFAPNFGMTKAAVQRALIVLCLNDRTRIVRSQGKPDRIALNPIFFPVYRCYRWPGN